MALLIVTDVNGKKHEYPDVDNDWLADALEKLKQQSGDGAVLRYVYPDGTRRETVIAYGMVKVVDHTFD
ncbi:MULTISPECIES: hypothetical protein [unclassified Deinococcus]|uniref:hypothetical protein n=1 Tax=unclassified Deinococcus TaxID=2623546 RepID=UPI001055567C|nr:MULTISPECIES: hypothetical protein [unclassified Deinococcus]MBI0447194.1 hypothetical protein [Deinococcus sp. DB0503]TDE85307.1 hypothetical protein E0686_12285 [Deinococcus sp. S9]